MEVERLWSAAAVAWLIPKKPIYKRFAATGIEGTESNAIRTLRWQSLEPSDESSHHQVHP
jgi:hypothetical protein